MILVGDFFLSKFLMLCLGWLGCLRCFEFVDYDFVYYVKESVVLMLVEFGFDEGEWFCFVFLDVIIYWKDGKIFVNFFMVYLEGFLVICGLFEIDEEIKKCVFILFF